METIIQKIKADIFSTAGEFAMATWVKFLLFGLISGAIMLSILSTYFYISYGISFYNFAMLMNDPTSINNFMFAMAYGGASIGPIAATLLSLLFTASLLGLNAWGYNVQFSFITDYINKKNTPFGTSLANGLDNRLLKLVGFFLLMALLYIGIIIVLTIFAVSFRDFLDFLVTKSGLLVAGAILTVFFLIFSIFLRFALSLPAISIGKMKTMEGIKFSLDHISYKKGMKYTGILFLLTIIYLVAIVIIQFTLGFFFDSMPMILFFISMAVTLFIGSFISAYISGLVVSLYYRESEAGEIEEEVNLV